MDVSHSICRDFQNFLLDRGLEDLGFYCSPFTWHRGGVREHVDMAVVNVQWRILFEEASLFHLPNFKSDYVPLLLQKHQSVKRNGGRRPFGFLVSSLTHEDFSDLVRKTWKQGEDWSSNISSFTRAVQVWNKSIFGNIILTKHWLMSRLHGIATQLSTGWNPYLINL